MLQQNNQSIGHYLLKLVQQLFSKSSSILALGPLVIPAPGYTSRALGANRDPVLLHCYRPSGINGRVQIRNTKRTLNK
jgi:hypothetical protein